MVGTINTRSLLPKLSIVMLTDVNNIPADLTQETSLNGKYLKGIATAVTDPDVNIGNSTHTHTSDGDHGHSATVPSHSHSGTSGAGPSEVAASGFGNSSFGGHTHSVSSNSQALAEASSDGAHTHNSFTNDLEHRTISFYKKTNTSLRMSRKSLPRNMTLFYSKTGTLPQGLLENLNYVDKHFKGDATPNTEAGSNLHQHDSIIHNHPTDISDHEHTLSFGGGPSDLTGGTSGPVPFSNGGHGHSSNTAVTINKSSTPITSGNSAGHQHDDITHEPAFKTLRLLEVNSLKMSNVGVPKNCIALWLDQISQLVNGWQVSDGTNGTIDMLGKYPKGNTTPDSTGGSDTHTHSNDGVSHSHTGADVGHSHGTTGSSSNTATHQGTTGGSNASVNHIHTPGSVSTQAAQPITITSSASNHDHGAQDSQPEAKTTAFIQRV